MAIKIEIGGLHLDAETIDTAIGHVFPSPGDPDAAADESFLRGVATDHDG